MTTAEAIRHRLAAIASAAQTAADARDGARLDLCEGSMAQLLVQLDTLAGRLDLVLDRLSAAVEPARVKPDAARLEMLIGHRD
jgi:hypothetical protein